MYCFSKCCRLCLSNNNTLVNFKCSGSDGVSFLDKLRLVAPSLIANSRDYDMIWICKQCRKKLKKAFKFIQDCFKTDALLDEYYLQLTCDNVQNKCTNLEVSDFKSTENNIKESIDKISKEECFEDKPAISDAQYYFEDQITIDKHELSPVNFKIESEPLELKQEHVLKDGDSSNYEIILPSECNRNQADNVQIADTNGENNILSRSVDPNDAKDGAYSCNMNTSNLLTKDRTITRKKLQKKNFECVICDKKFSRPSALNGHKRVHSGERPYKCKTCDKTFTGSRNLKQHERIHSGERPYKCKICDMKFALSSTLKCHEFIHSDERPYPYKCKICDMKFTKSAHLKRHEAVHSSERPFKCSICDLKFKRFSHLKRHERIHSGERPYQCKICDKKYTRYSYLKRHSAERAYDCKICERKFFCSGDLKLHAKVHSGERCYECKICNMKFKQSTTLKLHVLVHSVERPYKCKICDLKFIRPGDLKQHEKVHSGVRPYKCKICDMKFTRSDHLKRHAIVHSVKRLHKCKICNLKFTQSRYLRRHTSKVHQEIK